MPVILAPGDYPRWLGDELDPCELMRPFPRQPDADVADLDEVTSLRTTVPRLSSRWSGQRTPRSCGVDMDLLPAPGFTFPGCPIRAELERWIYGRRLEFAAVCTGQCRKSLAA